MKVNHASTSTTIECSGSLQKNIYCEYETLLFFMLLLVSPACYGAALTSARTDTIQGRAPTATIPYIALEGADTVPLSFLRITDDAVMSYTFSDADGDTEFDSSYIWRSRATQTAPFVDITNSGNPVTSQKFTIPDSLAGSEVISCVTPRTSPASTLPFYGTQMCSDPLTVVGKPVASSLRLKGRSINTGFLPNTFVSATYQYDGASAGIEKVGDGGTQYKWEEKTGTYSGDITQSGVVPHYLVPMKTDYYQTFSLYVQPVSQYGVVGDTAYAVGFIGSYNIMPAKQTCRAWDRHPSLATGAGWIWTPNLKEYGVKAFTNLEGVSLNKGDIQITVNVDDGLNEIIVNGVNVNISGCSPVFDKRRCTYTYTLPTAGSYFFTFIVFNSGREGGLSAVIKQGETTVLSTTSVDAWRATSI